MTELNEVSSFKFNPGAQLTLVTDGVVEARNAQLELFGFERTASISTGTVEKVARAAYSFGQG